MFSVVQGLCCQKLCLETCLKIMVTTEWKTVWMVILGWFKWTLT